MFRYAIGQLKSNKFIKIMTVLVLSLLVVIFSTSIFLNDAVLNFLLPRYYNPNGKVDVTVSAAGGNNFISEDQLGAYGQYIDELTPTMNLYALCKIGEKSQFAAISGVHTSKLFFNEELQKVDGTLFYQPNECVVPYSFAESFGVVVGDTLKMECNKKAVDITVVGIFKAFKEEGVLETIYMSDKTTSNFIIGSYYENLHNTLNVRLNGSISAAEFIKLLQRDDNAPNMKCVLAKDVNKLNVALNLVNMPVTACVIVLALLVLAVVFALYYLDSIKQHKLIVIFRDLGASTRQIFAVFMWSHFIIGLVGGLIGMGLAAVVAAIISTFSGIYVNIFAVVVIGFAMLVAVNFVVSLASTAFSVMHRKVKIDGAPKRANNIIMAAIIVACPTVFSIIYMLPHGLLGAGIIKNLIGSFAIALLLAAVCAVISFAYKLYRIIYSKIFAKTTKANIWLAKASYLNSKQTRNFFVILSIIGVTLVTSSGVLYNVRNSEQSTYLNHGDSVICCANIEENSKDEFEKILSEYDTVTYWTSSDSLYFTEQNRLAANVNVLDIPIIDDMTIFSATITQGQREYFASDSIGMYYSVSRGDILKEKIGAIKTVATQNGEKNLPYLGDINEKAYAMTDVIINRATAEYLGISCSIAYVRLLGGKIEEVLADTKSVLFSFGIVAEKQSTIEQSIENANKPLADMFNIANIILGALMFLTLIFYVVIMANYQSDNFTKLKALGMSSQGILVSQTALIVPLCILSGLLSIGLCQVVMNAFNVLFTYLSVGAIRYSSGFISYALPFILVSVAVATYLISHAFAIRKRQSSSTDLER